MKVAFFDRDGTIIEDYPDEKWTNITVPVFLSGAIETLREVQQKGYEIIIITNQYLIEEGFITLQQYEEIHKQFIAELTAHGISILDVFYCPHQRDRGCSCIKPKTGMIEKALKKYPDISLKDSFIIGDSNVDIQLAINMKIKGFGIGMGSSHASIHKLNEVKELTNYI